ncbi:hypothetical protein JOE59_000737 [Agromyces cerinus]|uniref:DUF2304 domain-containing protein n=1 Tax=Agromyces cerinus TaxID=33878 RepID=UPI00195DF2E6|nr:DUF2304 domain-containing protein [Agromyces cerinus]MBM7830032.1 hypothetical protein [Agromyces cerinus]
MSTATYLLGVVAGIIAFVAVIELLRRRRLRERHAIWWSVAAFGALLIGIFPGMLTWLASALGVEVPTNLVFFISIVILFLVNLQHAGELTDLEDRTRALAEEAALQRVKLERLERGTGTHDADD